MLGILSVVNWLMGGLYGLGAVAVLVLSVVGTPTEYGPVVIGIVLTVFASLCAMHLYAAVGVEKGHARTAQSILAVINLISVPVGTLYGLFALWVVWSAEADVFEAAESGEPPAPTRENRPRKKSNRNDGRTPYEAARALLDAGATARDVQLALRDRELPEDEVETLMQSLGLKYLRSRR